jgi:hypothetical protein
LTLRHPGEAEVGRRARRGGRDRLAFQIGDLRDAGLDDHAVGAIALVELEDLRRGHAVGVPRDPGFDRGRGALHVTGGDREVAVFLRDFLDRHIQPVLLEQARFIGKRQRGEAGPARDRDCDLGVLGVGRRCQGRRGQRQKKDGDAGVRTHRNS